MEIFGHESNPVNPLEDSWGSEKMHSFQSLWRKKPWKSLKNHSQIVFTDCSLFLIG
jgi:hypothetical protein